MVLLKLAETQDGLLDSTKVPRTLNRASSRTRDHLELETNVHLNHDLGNNSGVMVARVDAVERLIWVISPNIITHLLSQMIEHYLDNTSSNLTELLGWLPATPEITYITHRINIYQNSLVTWQCISDRHTQPSPCSFIRFVVRVKMINYLCNFTYKLTYVMSPKSSYVFVITSWFVTWKNSPSTFDFTLDTSRGCLDKSPVIV